MTSFLYVEDDALSRDVMSLILVRMLGFSQVTILEDSSDFVSKLEAIPYVPDVILLDIHIQPTDGFSMLRQLRDHAAYKYSRIVALTASVMNEEVERLRSAGFDGVIPKPVNMDTFEEVLGRILSGEQVWGLA
jgi:two-component system, cell cycle response regulator DivK